MYIFLAKQVWIYLHYIFLLYKLLIVLHDLDIAFEQREYIPIWYLAISWALKSLLGYRFKI